MEIYSVYPWKGNDKVRLTAYIHQPGPREPKSAGRPAVIVMPGGAYCSVFKGSAEGDGAALAFSAEGYQTFVLEYTVGSEARFPAQILDYAASVKVIREHASEWNTDTERISVLGFSAGGHLAGMIATAWHLPRFAQAVGLEPINLKPLCAMLLYGVLDLSIQLEYNKRSGGGGSMFLNVFGTEEPTEDMMKAFSPAQLVTENTCPVFLAAARNDSMVPSVQTLKMALMLSNRKIPYELHLFENGDHLFATGQSHDIPWREDLKYTASAWLPLAKKFLLRHAAPETAEHEQRILSPINRK